MTAEFTDATLQLLAARSSYKCELRGAFCMGDATDAHHRQRRGIGDDSISNAVHACRTCHAYAHAHPAMARDAGWIVSAWGKPAEVPVRRRGRWVLLTPDGHLEPTTERP